MTAAAGGAGARQTAFVASRGAQLFVTASGDPGAPTMVLVHGYPDTHRVWDELAELLRDRFHVVAYDTRGTGRSTAPADEDAFAMHNLTADLRAVIDAVSPERPVHLVGHDWGAFQCWAAVMDQRVAERIASVTAIAGPRLDHARGWIRRRLRNPGRHAAIELARQARRSWYVAAFQIPKLPEALIKLAMERSWPRVMRRLEGIEPRDGHPAATLTRDAQTGLALYRTNMLSYFRRAGAGAGAPSAAFGAHPDLAGQTASAGRGLEWPTARAGRAPASVPVQVVIALRDRYISPALYDDADTWAQTVWRRELDTGHWVQRSHPRELARYICELVEHTEPLLAPQPTST